MKLQGKNADVEVPTAGKNLRQPWKLSPRAGDGEQGTCTGPPLHPLRALDYAGKGSRSPDSSSAAHMQHRNFGLKRLSLQISLDVSEGMFAQNRCF